MRLQSMFKVRHPEAQVRHPERSEGSPACGMALNHGDPSRKNALWMTYLGRSQETRILINLRGYARALIDYMCVGLSHRRTAVYYNALRLNVLKIAGL